MTEPLATQVCQIVAEAIAHRYWLRPKPEVTRATLFEDLGADSLDLVTIAMACDERFGLDLCTDEVARWTGVADVLASVKGRATA